MNSPFSLVLLGDWVPEASNVSVQLPESAMTLVNLEGPVLHGPPPKPIKKAGPHLFSRSAPGPQSLNSRKVFCSLANNHFMDFGREGALETVSHLEESHTDWGGFGENTQEAQTPKRYEVDGVAISILCRTERQFGSAQLDAPGVAGMSPTLYSEIQAEKAENRFVIVSFHGGQEDISIPSPARKSLFRSFVDVGADVVWGHHPHTPQPFELYQGKLISYGHGNFLVDYSKWQSSNMGLVSLVALGKWTGKDAEIVWSFRFSKVTSSHSVDLIPEDSEEHRAYSDHLSGLAEILQDDIQHGRVWNETAIDLYNEYAANFLGWQRGAGLRRLLGFRKEALPEVRFHMFSCESHREVVETALGKEIGEIDEHKDD